MRLPERCRLIVRAVAIITDWAVLDAWQRFVVDPLQIRGISLDWQYVVFLIIMLLLLLSEVIHEITEHHLVLAAFLSSNLGLYLWRALEGRPFRDPGPNPMRYIMLLTCFRLMLLLCSLLQVSVLAGLWLLDGVFRWRSAWILFVHAAMLCASCETKPPRPKKIRHTVPTPEWI